MKKLVSVILLLYVILSLASCSCCNTVTDDFLIEKGMRVIGEVERKSESDAWIATYNCEIDKDLLKGDYSKYAAVYKVEYDIDSVLKSSLGESYEEIKDLLHSMALTAKMSQINSAGGTSAIIAASVVNSSSAFAAEGLEEPVQFIYVFEEGRPIAVSFIPGDGAVTANACLILADNFDTSSADSIKSSLGEGVLSCTKIG